jgi:hypothetical protein
MLSYLNFRESRRKELAARVIQRFFRVHMKVDSWRQKFIELDFNRIRELQHYTGQTFKDFEEFRSFCKKKMAVDYDFMTKIVGFFGRSYNGQITRRRASTADAPPDMYRKIVLGESLGVGTHDRKTDSTSPRSHAQTSGSSVHFSDEERHRTSAYFPSYAEDHDGAQGMRSLLDEAAEKKRLEEEKEKRVGSMRNKLAVMAREKFGDEIRDIMNRKDAPQPSSIHVASNSSFSVINKDLSRSGAKASFDAPQQRPASALSRNTITSKASFDAPTNPPYVRQLHKSTSGPVLSYAMEAPSDYDPHNNNLQRVVSGVMRPLGERNSSNSKGPIVVTDDPRM